MGERGKKFASGFELADGFEFYVQAGISSVGWLIRFAAGADVLWHWRQIILRYCKHQVPVFALVEQTVDMVLARRRA